MNEYGTPIDCGMARQAQGVSSCVARLSHVTTDHAWTSRRRTAPSPTVIEAPAAIGRCRASRKLHVGCSLRFCRRRVPLVAFILSKHNETKRIDK